MAKNARQLCFDALCKVYQEHSYSSIVLDQVLTHNQSSVADKTLATALYYAVIERDLTLCHVINCYSKRKAEKLDVPVAVILKMGLCQLLYFDHIPDRAAVNESVSLCYYAKKASAKGMVNAILRGFLRDEKNLQITSNDKVKQRSLTYSCPEWLIRKWNQEYSEEITEKLLQASIGRPPLTIRVNTQKTTDEQLVEQLESHGVKLEKSQFIEHCYHIEHGGNLAVLPEFKQGLFYVQDSSSQFCAKLLDAKPNMTVYDLCAAPGSKTFTIAQWMENQGTLCAFDLHGHRVKLIEEAAKRLGLSSIQASVSDATVYDKNLPKADRVLCDVPCAGLGVIRRKPEIKYKTPESLQELPVLQKSILENGARYVKNGGMILYSTCSLSYDENEAVVAWFLKSHPNFSSVSLQHLQPIAQVDGNMATFFPHLTNSDGFFVALFGRTEEEEN